MSSEGPRKVRVELAAAFLAHPVAKGSEWEVQREFLLSKGVQEDELQEAYLQMLTGKAPTWPLKPLQEVEDLPAAPAQCTERAGDAAAGGRSKLPAGEAQVLSDEDDGASSSSSSSSSSSKSNRKSTAKGSGKTGSSAVSQEPKATPRPPAPKASRPAPAPRASASTEGPGSSSSGEESSSSSSSSSSLPTKKADKPQGKTQSSALPAAASAAVVYRSDNELWPPGMEGRPLVRSQRIALRRVASKHGEPYSECMRDLQDAKQKAAEFRRACPGKQEVLDLCAQLEVEAEKLRCEWCNAVDKVQAGWKREVTTSARLPTTGVRPQVVRGRRWYCACVVDEGKRILGPLRPSAKEAAADHALMAPGDAVASAAPAPAAASGPAAAPSPAPVDETAKHPESSSAAVPDGGKEISPRKRKLQIR
eukprot:TRINITY_DN29405_c0_g1_i1.p1 TRINITY_DN29405_c0_g1~~TRINITY_DN29405_c0_g1_i1.p1  ORF type:complete len:421 (-),score=107.86 TRINITY_DN29405_c0_g1_i1:56-1318(-)